MIKLFDGMYEEVVLVVPGTQLTEIINWACENATYGMWGTAKYDELSDEDKAKPAIANGFKRAKEVLCAAGSWNWRSSYDFYREKMEETGSCVRKHPYEGWFDIETHEFLCIFIFNNQDEAALFKLTWGG